MDNRSKGEELLDFFAEAYPKLEKEEAPAPKTEEATATTEADPASDALPETSKEEKEEAEQKPVQLSLTDFTDALATGIQQAKEKKEGEGKTRILQDFGKKIGGARKDAYNTYKALLAQAMRTETHSDRLTVLWPAPKYDALRKAGMEPWRVAAIRALRDAAPMKKDKRNILELREYAAAVLKGEYPDEVSFQQAFIPYATTRAHPLTGRQDEENYWLADFSSFGQHDKSIFSHVFHLEKLYSALGTEKSLKNFYILENTANDTYQLCKKDNSLGFFESFHEDFWNNRYQDCGEFSSFEEAASKVKELAFADTMAKEAEEAAPANPDMPELIPGTAKDYVISFEHGSRVSMTEDNENPLPNDPHAAENITYTISRKINSELTMPVATVTCKELHKEYLGDKVAPRAYPRPYDRYVWQYARDHIDELNQMFSENVQSKRRFNQMKHYQVDKTYSPEEKRHWVIQRKIDRHKAVTVLDIPLSDSASADNASRFAEFHAAKQYFFDHFDEAVKRFKELSSTPQERNAKNAPRTGKKHRAEDVTPELYQETFGFHGVEFGNWEEGTTRQENLNASYEALLDLADALHVEPKALSLGGTLSLRFGSNGRGGKNAPSAHYEPTYKAINLTKMNGAGCLAHEWFHALDDYLGRKAGLRNLLSKQIDLKSAAESARMIVRKKENGWSLASLSYDEKSYQNKISYFLKAAASLNSALREETVKGFVDAFTAMVHDSNVAGRAGVLDATKKKPYWSSRPELFARTFEAFVKAELSEKGVRNDFLVNFRTEKEWEAAYGKIWKNAYPYPTKAELPTICKGFRSFFDSIQTKTNEEGKTEFFSCSRMDCLSSLVEVSTVVPASALSEEQNGLAAFSLEQLGLPVRYFDGPDALHGRYDAEEDILYLNRKGESSVGWTFYHEAFHALKKNDPKLYQDLLTFTEQTELFTPGQMDAYRKEIHGKNLTDAQVKEEMLADAFADAKTGERTLTTIATKEPNLAVRVTSYFRRVADKAVSFFHRRKKQHPKAELTEKQFAAFREHLQTVTQNLRADGRYVLSDRHNILGCEGYPVTPQDLPDTMIHFANPFPGDYKKQMAFDIASSTEMLKKYSSEVVLDTLSKNSPLREEPGYVKTVLREANRRYRKAYQQASR